MLIEIGSPATLPLGFVKLSQDNHTQIYQLGLTVQHPPINLFVQAGQGDLNLVGARADVAYKYARRYLNQNNLPHNALGEIELASPAFMGFGSEAMIGLSTARALAWLNQQPTDDVLALARTIGLESRYALQVRGFEQGGLLLLPTETPPNVIPAPTIRREIQHDDKQAWALVLYFPRVDTQTVPADLETQLWQGRRQAAQHLTPMSGSLVINEMLPAIENDDIERFGKALMYVQEMNEAALAKARQSFELTDQDKDVLQVMKNSGAVAWGQSMEGMGLFALVHGANATRSLRSTLREQVGHYGGLLMTTVTDNRGGQMQEQDDDLTTNKFTPIRRM